MVFACETFESRMNAYIYGEWHKIKKKSEILRLWDVFIKNFWKSNSLNMCKIIICFMVF